MFLCVLYGLSDLKVPDSEHYKQIDFYMSDCQHLYLETIQSN